MLPSIQISVTISEKELSLSELYRCLLGKSNTPERSQLIRQVLFDKLNANPFGFARKESIPSCSQSGVKVRFSINSRDIGFELLYHELASMCTSSARNRYVRKLLYQACQSASQPTAVGEKLSTVTETHIGAVPMGAHRQESESQIPQSSQDFSLTPEKIAALQAEKKALRHRKNIEAMKQELPDTPSVAPTTTTI